MTATVLTRCEEDALAGSLVVKADIVTSDMVDIAMQISAGFGESLLTVLKDTNRISESDLQNVLRAQQMVKSGLVDESLAARALHFSHKTRLAFQDTVLRLFHEETMMAQAA